MMDFEEALGAASKISCRKESGRIALAISRFMRQAGARFAVIGVSGGLDSAVCAALCSRALGKSRVIALVLPSGLTPAPDLRDARLVARKYAGTVHEMGIEPIIMAAESAISRHTSIAKEERGNLAARARMMLLYNFARHFKGVVMGTGDASELAIGYFTKYGDGGCDVLPIGSLRKTQVRKIAKFLGVPPRVCSKPPSPQLWSGHSAQAELGLNYKEIDVVLFLLKSKRKALAGKLVGRKKMARILSMVSASGHKRKVPPIF